MKKGRGIFYREIGDILISIISAVQIHIPLYGHLMPASKGSSCRTFLPITRPHVRCHVPLHALILYIPAPPRPWPLDWVKMRSSRDKMTENTPPAELRHRRAVSPPLPWTTRLSLSLFSAVSDASQRSDGTVNRCLFSFIDFRSPASRKPTAGVRTADITVDPSRKLWFRLFVPASANGDRVPVIVFFHGGGFAFFSPDSRPYDEMCRRFCRKIPAVIVSVNYRLSPENRCPAPYDDGADVLRFLDDGGLARSDPAAAELADLSSCFLAGDSAGGNIAHHVARRWASPGGQGWKSLKLAGVVAIQPYFGGEERTEAEIRLKGAPLVSMEATDWLWKAFLPEGADRDHPAANVFGPRAAALEEGFPAAMVVVGGFDPLEDRQRRYYEGLRARGREAKLVEYPDAIHGFYAFPELKESAELIADVKDFVERRRNKFDG